MKPGKYSFIQQEQVIWGRPAADAISDVADELGAQRLFIVASKTLNRNTDVVAGIRRRLGARAVGLFDETEEHSPQGSVLRTAAAIAAAEPDLIVTIGGGSPIDTVKVAQIVLAEGIETEAQLSAYRVTTNADGSWNIAKSKPSPIRQIVVPTTLSAAEFSNIGGSTDRVRQVKDLYVGKTICAQAVILDPAVTVHTPEWLWLSTGIRAVDLLAHAEPLRRRRQPRGAEDAVGLAARQQAVAGRPRHATAEPARRVARLDRHRSGGVGREPRHRPPARRRGRGRARPHLVRDAAQRDALEP